MKMLTRNGKRIYTNIYENLYFIYISACPNAFFFLNILLEKEKCINRGS